MVGVAASKSALRAASSSLSSVVCWLLENKVSTHWRKIPRSSTGIPSSSAITITGRGYARRSTRSKRSNPRSSSSSSAVSSAIRCARPVTMRGVKAWLTRLRSLWCFGGSMRTKLPRANSSKSRCCGMISLKSDENALGSDSTRSASAYPNTCQMRCCASWCIEPASCWLRSHASRASRVKGVGSAVDVVACTEIPPARCWTDTTLAPRAGKVGLIGARDHRENPGQASRRGGSGGFIFVVMAPPVRGFVAALRRAVEPLVGPPQAIKAAGEGGIAMIDLAIFQHEGAHARALARVGGGIGAGHLGADDGAAAFRRRVGGLAAVVVFGAAFALLLLGQRHAEIPIEIAVEGGRPGEGPAHAPAKGLQLGERGAGDGPEHHIVVGEVHREAVEAVRDRRAGRAAGAVIGSEHEMIDEQLRAALEQIGQGGAAFVGVETIFLVDLHPGQFLAAARQLVAAAGQVLLGLEQVEALCAPLFAGSNPVGRHRFPLLR